VCTAKDVDGGEQHPAALAPGVQLGKLISWRWKLTLLITELWLWRCKSGREQHGLEIGRLVLLELSI